MNRYLLEVRLRDWWQRVWSRVWVRRAGYGLGILVCAALVLMAVTTVQGFAQRHHEAVQEAAQEKADEQYRQAVSEAHAAGEPAPPPSEAAQQSAESCVSEYARAVQAAHDASEPAGAPPECMGGSESAPVIADLGSRTDGAVEMWDTAFNFAPGGSEDQVVEVFSIRNGLNAPLGGLRVPVFPDVQTLEKRTWAVAYGPDGDWVTAPSATLKGTGEHRYVEVTFPKALPPGESAYVAGGYTTPLDLDKKRVLTMPAYSGKGVLIQVAIEKSAHPTKNWILVQPDFVYEGQHANNVGQTPVVLYSWRLQGPISEGQTVSWTLTPGPDYPRVGPPPLPGH